MNSHDLSALLERLNAFDEALEWAQGKDLQTFWDTCPRADLLLCLVGRMVGEQGWPTRNEIVLAACDCAETALKYVPQCEDRPRTCIETVRAWVEGKASLEAVREARRASASASASAATYASAYAAVYSASAYAAYAAYAAAYAAAVYAARAGVPQKRLVEIVRKRIPVPYKEVRA